MAFPIFMLGARKKRKTEVHGMGNSGEYMRLSIEQSPFLVGNETKCTIRKSKKQN